MAGLDHALVKRGLLKVETARQSASGLRRGSYGRWLGGSVQRAFVTVRVTPTEEGRRQTSATEVSVMADQLWVVFLDGVAQKGVLPYAGSEEKALSMWREQTGLRRIARARLRAAPKVEADVPASPGAVVPSTPIPSSRSAVLTTEEQAAIRAWADEEGPRWKAALRLAWKTGNYGGSEHHAPLQRIRNRLGPSWLVKYRLPVEPSDETKGYRCWVVIRRQPHRIRAWVATTRAEAVLQVKDAVRNNKTEGGVESRDPERPFEATFSLVRGKLVTTKFTD